MGSQGTAKDKVVTSVTAVDPQRLTPNGQALLDQWLGAAELSDLQRPHFAEYQPELRKFYGAMSGTLPWIEGGEPAPQAYAMIRSLKNAEFEGLTPDDYDGSKWDERMARFTGSPGVSEPELVRFDLALTICTMRYVSDLHVGRANPRIFHFDLDIDHRPSISRSSSEKSSLPRKTLRQPWKRSNRHFPCMHEQRLR